MVSKYVGLEKKEGVETCKGSTVNTGRPKGSYAVVELRKIEKVHGLSEL